MAFRKRPAEGENDRFTSIGPNGDNLDPTEGPPSGSGVPTPQNPYGGERWGQVDRGSRDNSGSRHDW